MSRTPPSVTELRAVLVSSSYRHNSTIAKQRATKLLKYRKTHITSRHHQSSHTCTVVLECYKDNRWSGNGEIWTTTRPHPSTNRPKNLQGWLRDGYKRCAKFHKDLYTVFISTHARLCAPSVYSAIFSCFVGSFTGLQPRPLNDFDVQYVDARVSVQGCAFWAVSKTTLNI